jgi:hypothetical protein
MKKNIKIKKSTNMQTVLQTVDKFSDIAKLFSKNKYFKTEILQ